MLTSNDEKIFNKINEIKKVRSNDNDLVTSFDELTNLIDSYYPYQLVLEDSNLAIKLQTIRYKFSEIDKFKEAINELLSEIITEIKNLKK